MLERIERESKIWCPHCGDPYEDEENHCVSYWGQDNDAEYGLACGSCGQEFIVKEHVRRTYESLIPEITEQP